MNARSLRTLIYLVLFSFCLARLFPLAAAEDDKANETELKRKAEEVNRLKDELTRAQQELKKLREDNERLRQEQARTPNAPPPVVEKPVTPMKDLGALQTGEVVELHNLVGHFKADPAAAAERYQKRIFRLRGEIARFDTKLVLRNYNVLLASPDKAVLVVCNFNYVDSKFSTIYTKQSGQVLAGRMGDRGETKLLQVGETVVIEGKCGGLKDGEIRLSGCHLLR